MAIKKLVKAKPVLVNAPKKLVIGGETELGNVLSQISNTYGKEVAAIAASRKEFGQRIPTSIFSLDLGLAGGWLNSRACMLYGERSSGKSTTAMKTVVMAQQMFPDLGAVWIDVEGTFDTDWFVKLGGDLDRLAIAEPETGEHAVDMADALVRAGETSILVTDSIAMLVPFKEIDQSAEDSLPGLHARLIGNFLRRTTQALLQERHRGHRPLLVHINQFRMKIGVMFGDPRTLPGGKALEFCTTQQVEIKNKEHIDKDGSVAFNEHSFKITKDKSGGRIREGQFKLIRSPEANDGLPEGFVEQAKTMFDVASRVGLTDGSPQAKRLEFKGFGSQKTFLDWNHYFAKDPEALVRCQAAIIRKYREQWGIAA
jgi:recombination protein RecA